jgi:hypothetical protein
MLFLMIGLQLSPVLWIISQILTPTNGFACLKTPPSSTPLTPKITPCRTNHIPSFSRNAIGPSMLLMSACHPLHSPCHHRESHSYYHQSILWQPQLSNRGSPLGLQSRNRGSLYCNRGSLYCNRGSLLVNRGRLVPLSPWSRHCHRGRQAD